MQVASVHHEYGRLTLATAGLLLWMKFCLCGCQLEEEAKGTSRLEVLNGKICMEFLVGLQKISIKKLFS